MTRPSTPMRDAVLPLELTAAKLAGESTDRVAAVRWRDTDGQEGQSSVGEIASERTAAPFLRSICGPQCQEQPSHTSEAYANICSYAREITSRRRI